VTDLVKYLAANLVNDRSQVRVQSDDQDTVRLSVAPSDRGAIIGKGGRTIKAIRTLMRTAAVRSGGRAQLKLED